jgi:hypothetical protein
MWLLDNNVNMVSKRCGELRILKEESCYVPSFVVPCLYSVTSTKSPNRVRIADSTDFFRFYIIYLLTLREEGAASLIGRTQLRIFLLSLHLFIPQMRSLQSNTPTEYEEWYSVSSNTISLVSVLAYQNTHKNTSVAFLMIASRRRIRSGWIGRCRSTQEFTEQNKGRKIYEIRICEITEEISYITPANPQIGRSGSCRHSVCWRLLQDLPHKAQLLR